MNDDTLQHNGEDDNIADEAEEASAQPQKNKETDGCGAAKENEKDHWRRRSSSRRILEKCLKESFSQQGKLDLVSIIENNLKKLARTISHDDHIDDIIRQLLTYCTDRNDFDGLWEEIKAERKEQYNEFFSVWKASYDKEQEEMRNEELATQHNKRIKDEQKKQTEDKDITKWFFDELDYVEQSMVITAALFQGVERSSFNEITQDIHELLFPPEQEIPKSESPSEENLEESEQQKEKQVPFQLPRLKNEVKWTP